MVQLHMSAVTANQRDVCMPPQERDTVDITVALLVHASGQV